MRMVYWTGQSGRDIGLFISILATSDDGISARGETNKLGSYECNVHVALELYYSN